MPVLEVKTIEPAALSPKGTCVYLSLSKRSVSTLIASGVLIAKRTAGRTLVDFESVKKYYASLPVKTVATSIPNAPQSAALERRCEHEPQAVTAMTRGERANRIVDLLNRKAARP